MIAFTAQSLLTPGESIAKPLVLVEEGIIAEVRARDASEIPRGVRVVNFGETTIAPAYIDIHIHGGAGHDVMRADADGLARFEQSLAGHGVGSYFPTTVTA
ncbi:MAG: N-acetylglucosamine-6-phosphate deacetylase, partial [Terriglobales bacterium]